MNRVLITGGAGFIGEALARRLVSEYEVVVYDDFRRPSPKSDWFTDHSSVTVVRGDVRDRGGLTRAMEGVDTVVHAAAIAGISTVDADPVETMEVNYEGTANVLAAAHAVRVSNRVVVLSTSEVFGPHADHVTERSPAVVGPATEERWLYAASKLAGEHIAFAYQRSRGLPVVVVRPFNVYGPGQVGEGAVKNFIDAALRNQPLRIYGTGSQVRSWCYIDDFIDGLVRCLEKPEALNSTWNIGNPEATVTIMELAEAVLQFSKTSSTIELCPPSAQDVQLRIPDVTRAQTVLGFNPQVSLQEGVVQTIKWFESVVV